MACMQPVVFIPKKKWNKAGAGIILMVLAMQTKQCLIKALVLSAKGFVKCNNFLFKKFSLKVLYFAAILRIV